MTNFSMRSLFGIGFLGCAAGLAFALYLQYAKNFDPCPMCIFQRIALVATGLVFLAGAAHAPARGGRRVYSLLALLTAAVGAGIAGRQVWLQHLPADEVPTCGPTLQYLLNMMPVSKVISFVLKGEGSCAKIDAQWLGVTLPEWTLVAFIGFALYALVAPRLARR